MTAKLCWILLLALLLRLGAAFAVQSYLDNVAHRNFLIPGDANGYWELGQMLAQGQTFEIFDPPRRIMRMPGFPALLAASIKLGGESLFCARCLIAFCGTAACGMTYGLGRQRSTNESDSSPHCSLLSRRHSSGSAWRSSARLHSQQLSPSASSCSPS